MAKVRSLALMRTTTTIRAKKTRMLHLPTAIPMVEYPKKTQTFVRTRGLETMEESTFESISMAIASPKSSYLHFAFNLRKNKPNFQHRLPTFLPL